VVITKVAGVRLEAAAMEAAFSAAVETAASEAAASEAAAVTASEAAAPYKAAAAATAAAMAAASAATRIGANGRQGQSADHKKSSKRSFDRCMHHNLPFLFTNTAAADYKTNFAPELVSMLPMK
jgi:hypothetical protein